MTRTSGVPRRTGEAVRRGSVGWDAWECGAVPPVDRLERARSLPDTCRGTSLRGSTTTLRPMSRARAFHLLTFLVAAFAVVLQLVLVIQGHRVLDEHNRPDLDTRLVRFCSYLTIWFNVLVAWSTFTLATGRDRDTPLWRALRLDAVVIATVGGLVHFFFLLPLLDLTGWDFVADKLLHMAVPALALVGWLVFGPRGRADRRDVAPFLVVPVAWLVYTLVRGELVEWYPYPFIDVNEHGYGVVLANALAVAAAMVLAVWGAVVLERRLAGRQAEDPAGNAPRNA